MSEFRRPRHKLVLQALAALDRGFLDQAKCYFGGGTRIAMALGEFRESADIDLLCADRDGYRALRSTVSDRSSVLGRDVIDLAFMILGWSAADAHAGFEQAREAYGKVVNEALKKAVRSMSERKDHMRRCASGLIVDDARKLARGLHKLSAFPPRPSTKISA